MPRYIVRETHTLMHFIKAPSEFDALEAMKSRSVRDFDEVDPHGSSDPMITIDPASDDAEFDEAQAVTEGWSLFQTTPDWPWELERLDDPQAYPDGHGAPREPVFINDDEACAFVVRKAASGSAYHRYALSFLERHSPPEFAGICKAHPVVGAMDLNEA